MAKLPNTIIDDIMREVIRNLLSLMEREGFATGGIIPRAPTDHFGWNAEGASHTVKIERDVYVAGTVVPADVDVPLGDTKCNIPLSAMEDPADIGMPGEGIVEDWISHGMTPVKQQAQVRKSSSGYDCWWDGEKVPHAEFIDCTGETPMEFYEARTKPTIPRKVTDLQQIRHLMPLSIYYDDTGEEVQNVMAYDLDGGYCWQHVMDENGRPEMDGKEIKMRRVNGQFTVCPPR